jgi:hypothetical protein
MAGAISEGSMAEHRPAGDRDLDRRERPWLDLSRQRSIQRSDGR